MTVEKHMDMSIHIRNRNGNALISKELSELPPKLSKLLLPPLTTEDPNTAKLEYITQLQENVLQKQTEQRQNRDNDKNNLSLLRQQFYKEHARHTKFDPYWRATLT